MIALVGGSIQVFQTKMAENSQELLHNGLIGTNVSEPSVIQAIRTEVVARFGLVPDGIRVVVAPYRICPLGAHVDHQLGTVTGMAVDRAVHLAFAPSRSRTVRLASLSFPGQVEFSIGNVPNRQAGDWGNYARGAVRALSQHHSLRQGIFGVTSGALAEGGLSSSAAFGIACLMALEEANGFAVSQDDNIVLDQNIENNYLGLRNGILDQAMILLSRREQLTWLDCRTRQHKRVTAGKDLPPFAILLAFSGLTKSLVSTDYNRRVEECTAAASLLLHAVGRPQMPPQLGNILPEEYAEHKHLLHGPESRRAEHFFTEIARVQQGVDAWQAGNLEQFGQLMTQSCDSSIHNYQCGAPPLATLQSLLISTPGVYGSRFSGAGFRGCCVAFVNPAAAEEIGQRVLMQYHKMIPELAAHSRVLICQSDDGARIV
jgi:galacturonokinase